MMKYLYRAALYPIRLYWFLFRPHGFGVKCIIRRQDGKVLLVRNTYGNRRWTLPGGGIKKGESPLQAARREIQEEVGIELEDIERLGALTSTEEYKRDHVQIFYAETDRSASRIDHDEIGTSGWFALDALPEPLGPIAEKGIGMLERKGK